jgi:uncharacterized membrane protein
MQKEHFLDRFHRNERLVGLSDGVFAIVLTLLVLELRVPQVDHGSDAKALWAALVGIRAKFISFLLSFMLIASLWFSHNQLFKLFDKVDNSMLWYNNFLLLLTCLIPFPTALIGEYPANPVGITLFGILYVFIPLVIYLIGTQALKRGYLHQTVDLKRFLAIRKLTLLFIPLSVIPIAIAWASPGVALACYLMMMVVAIIVGFYVKVIED